MSEAVSIVWFRQDLRLADNPALRRAIEAGRPIVPLFIWDNAGEGAWPRGGASQWWLHHALLDLEEQLAAIGLKLIVREGDTAEQFAKLMGELKIEGIFYNRRYEPDVAQRDQKLKEQWLADGLEVLVGNSAVLFLPSQIETKTGKPYQVFTPFFKQLLTQDWPTPVDVDLKAAKPAKTLLNRLSIDDLKLLPTIPWDKGFDWNATRAGGLGRLGWFIGNADADYHEARDIPAVDGTSKLSPYLHWGQIGSREVYAAYKTQGIEPKDNAFLREIAWHEFGYHLMNHFPHTHSEPLRPEFKDFPWEDDKQLLKAWQKGQTGIPIVDAGMRQLWHTGWMHNRVRMNVASVLVKHLLISWQHGAEWFWDTLVDADLPNNTLGWQWAGGCGADAAPYFRIFNPATQAERFDADGEYIRRWIPELEGLQGKALYDPSSAEPLELKAAGIKLGSDYPEPIIAHKAGRQRALDAFEKYKKG